MARVFRVSEETTHCPRSAALSPTPAREPWRELDLLRAEREVLVGLLKSIQSPVVRDEITIRLLSDRLPRLWPRSGLAGPVR